MNFEVGIDLGSQGMFYSSRSIFVAVVACLAVSAAMNGARAADGATVYKQVCSFCHDDGTVGAPKIGDRDAWKPRIGKGMDALYHNALTGKGHMPPRKERRGFSDDEIKSAVDYLIQHSR
jgi:cytochrome c5